MTRLLQTIVLGLMMTGYSFIFLLILYNQIKSLLGKCSSLFVKQRNRGSHKIAPRYAAPGKE